MSYAVQYTIDVLSGAYAQKYSVVWYDAARFVDLFAKVGGMPEAFAGDAARREYDGFVCFGALMKILKHVVAQKKVAFCEAIVRTQGEACERGSVFCDEDEAGPFEVRAYGATGRVWRGGEETAFEEMEGRRGTYRAVMTTVIRCYKDDLMNMLNLCEEAMAANGRIVAETVPMDTPAPEPLFRL